ncbi:hypothetical protein RB195_020655 [Necator americanus]|uniref:Uncharacterized protein n=1 Tax=Necator americanus TaxID=51031 RepID=A0ABR1CKQ0_NECAM
MDAVCLRLLVILVAIFPLTITDDACKFLNDDYCFRFGQMPCYQKICECEQKNCTDVTECVLSPWCDPSGKVLLTNERCWLAVRSAVSHFFNQLSVLYSVSQMPSSSHIPRIRSIIRFRLPKYFDPERYIWNRFSSADAILVDISKRDDYDSNNNDWRRTRLYYVLDKAPYRPRIYMEATNYRKYPNIWQKDMSVCMHPYMNGFIMNLKDGDVLREVDQLIKCGHRVEEHYKKLTQMPSPTFRNTSMLVDVDKQSIPYAIFKYHNFGARREGGWNHLKDLASKAQAANVQALGWRSRPIRRLNELEREMYTLKELGFVGVLLHDSDQIELANKTFSPINHDCNSLRKNCLNREKNNGYCFIYRGGCPKNEDVESKLEKSTSEKLLRRCQRWKRKCEQKYPKHYACKQLRRKCSALNITVTAGTNNDSLSSEEDRNEQLPKQKLEKMCTKWERKCAEKWPNHYSCRMLKKKCSFQNPIIQPITGLRAGNTTNSAESVNVNSNTNHLRIAERSWNNVRNGKRRVHRNIPSTFHADNIGEGANSWMHNPEKYEQTVP